MIYTFQVSMLQPYLSCLKIGVDHIYVGTLSCYYKRPRKRYIWFAQDSIYNRLIKNNIMLYTKLVNVLEHFR